MPPYYTYDEPYPLTPQHPGAVTWDHPSTWPKTYRYNPSQGIHPPAPVYVNNNPGQPGLWPYGYAQGMAAAPYGQAMPATFPMAYGTYPCYYQPAPQPQSPYGYFGTYTYTNPTWPMTSSQPSIYYPTANSPNSYKPAVFSNISYWFPRSTLKYLPPSSLIVPGQPAVYPTPACPQSMTAQAAAAAAANAALAQAPAGPAYFVGASPADFAAQQAIIAAQMMAAQAGQQAAPTSLAPYKPTDGQQFWCRELDGGWTLKTYSEIALGEVSPGHWERHAVSGYFYWVRTAM